MIQIEEATSYFNNCHEKFLRRFSEVTPEGNYIQGWICTKPNKYMGSLLIDTVNNDSHNQFIQSMPKIEYFNDERDICLDMEITDSFSDAVAYEKLDGSCLIIYPLLWDDGKIMEIVPKTRGKAVADKHFLELYDKIPKESIWEYYKNNKGILFFEMYGILNQHEIIHYDTGIDLVLIGEYYEDEGFADPLRLWKVANLYLFKQPQEMFRIRKNMVDIITFKYRWVFDEVSLEDKQAPTRLDSIKVIEGFLDYLNGKYTDWYGRNAIEGVVINCRDINGNQKYIKVKPKRIREAHTGEHGIPRSDIVKECLKYFDDYGAEVFDLYKKDKNHHTEYLYRMLSEDYSEEYIRKSKKKIERVFMQVWDNKQVPKSIHNICEEIIKEHGNEGVVGCMRVFAEEYPMKKNYATMVYNILKVKI